ncbi:hypothetical protein ASZ78_002586 [Callipepla squamata]|uniref:Keratin n=1 Tax=Callipepla squamata TaxID=9009 RepID=A0A226MQG0_CALSU|nr:hypothetical protein ASZ78_002586 [Callipepla squamata]
MAGQGKAEQGKAEQGWARYISILKMPCYTQCMPCRPCGPTPLASSCNESCVRQCQNSNVAIEPSPVVVTLPGPNLSSFPQNTVEATVAEGAHSTSVTGHGPREILRKTMNMALDREGIFQPLLSKFLTVLS